MPNCVSPEKLTSLFLTPSKRPYSLAAATFYPMGKSYSKASDDVRDRSAHLIKVFHTDLRDAGLRIDWLFVATDAEDGSPALTHGGYPADAVISVVGPKERALGNGDVKCVIDEARYLTMTAAEKDALLDHEIYHVELKRNKYGKVKLDEHGRPKVGMKKHDVQIGHFVEIAKRHGAASGEVQQMTGIYLKYRQELFSFAQDADLLKRLESA